MLIDQSLGFLAHLPAYFWLLVHTGPAVFAVYHVLLYKRDPRSAMSWIMICLFVPFGGPVAYVLFGVNRVRTRARGLRKSFFAVEYEVGSRAAVPSDRGAGLESAGERVTGNVALPGNEIVPLYDGDAAYPAMLEAIRRSSHRVLLATYIFKPDRAGQAFADALEAAARRGVEVKILLDGIGELYSASRIRKRLTGRGITVARFLPPRLVPPSIYVNLRNHRKILLVDDDLAFVGGMNISDENVGSEQRPRAISDIHFRVRGPAASQLARVFANDWRFVTQSSLDPPSTQTDTFGSATCRVVPDGPDADLDALALIVQTAISSARQSIEIMTPYFLPPRDLIGSLISAALRGVRIRIVLPVRSNLRYVDWASRNVLAELLQWSAEIYYQPAPFCHSKLLCIDDGYSLIGSANLDSRSLRLNFEVGVEVFSRDLVRELREHFDRVIATAVPATLEQLAARSIPERLRDSAAGLFSPYL